MPGHERSALIWAQRSGRRHAVRRYVCETWSLLRRPNTSWNVILAKAGFHVIWSRIYIRRTPLRTLNTFIQRHPRESGDPLLRSRIMHGECCNQQMPDHERSALIWAQRSGRTTLLAPSNIFAHAWKKNFEDRFPKPLPLRHASAAYT